MAKSGHPPFDERQLAEMHRRYAAGESARTLAREFHCGAATVSRHCSTKAERIKNVANKVVEADRALETLLPVERGLALRLADDLKATSANLARGARATSETFADLAEMARDRKKSAKREDGTIDPVVMSDVSALTVVANRAALPALRLVTSSQEPPEGEPSTPADLDDLSDDELRAFIRGALDE